MRYEFKFDVPYTLDAYEHVTLKERLEGEVKSFLGEKELNCNLGREDW